MSLIVDARGYTYNSNQIADPQVELVIKSLARNAKKDNVTGCIHAVNRFATSSAKFDSITAFLFTTQRFAIPNQIKAPLHATALMLHGTCLPAIPPTLELPSQDFSYTKFREILTKNLPIIQFPRLFYVFPNSERPHLKELTARSENGEHVASFRLFQAHLINKFDKAQNNLVAIFYLAVAKGQGSEAAKVALKLLRIFADDQTCPLFYATISRLNPRGSARDFDSLMDAFNAYDSDVLDLNRD